MRNTIKQTSKKWLLLIACAASAMAFGAASAQSLSVSATPQSGDFLIKGSCVPGNGKPVLEFTPLQLNKPTYTGPKMYQQTWVTHDHVNKVILYFTAQAPAQAVAPGSSSQGCGNSGSGNVQLSSQGLTGKYLMEKTKWAKGSWQIKLIQGTNQSAPVTVNM